MNDDAIIKVLLQGVDQKLDSLGKEINSLQVNQAKLSQSLDYIERQAGESSRASLTKSDIEDLIETKITKLRQERMDQTDKEVKELKIWQAKATGAIPVIVVVFTFIMNRIEAFL